MLVRDQQIATDRLRRWRLILGGGAADGIGGSGLSDRDLSIDGALAALYGNDESADSSQDRKGGLGSSSPKVARWLGDIRTFFPTSVVRIMQQDALERLNLQRMLLEPEMLETIEPDVHLVSNLISLSGMSTNRGLHHQTPFYIFLLVSTRTADAE